jgi:hypothetical protein
MWDRCVDVAFYNNYFIASNNIFVDVYIYRKHIKKRCQLHPPSDVWSIVLVFDRLL